MLTCWVSNTVSQPPRHLSLSSLLQDTAEPELFHCGLGSMSSPLRLLCPSHTPGATPDTCHLSIFSLVFIAGYFLYEITSGLSVNGKNCDDKLEGSFQELCFCLSEHQCSDMSLHSVVPALPTLSKAEQPKGFYSSLFPLGAPPEPTENLTQSKHTKNVSQLVY